MIDLTQLVTAESKQAAVIASALAQLRSERQPTIAVLDGLQASALAAGNTVAATAIEAAKQGMRDITKTDLSACKTNQECKAAIMVAYKTMVDGLPMIAKIAFAKALA